MKRQWIAPILGVGIGAVLWGIWWVLAVSGLVPVLFVDGTFFTGIVLLVLALMTSPSLALPGTPRWGHPSPPALGPRRCSGSN